MKVRIPCRLAKIEEMNYEKVATASVALHSVFIQKPETNLND